ncbi:TRAP transporter large permease subunit [Geminicoccaceae bacterium 1502E]|nr:TRAP transporter large permease subunit [Geminicoccaceae bacterium 1502E]
MSSSTQALPLEESRQPRGLALALGGIAHAHRFIGHATGQLYLLCAFITVYEVVMRYVFTAPSQWAYEVVMVLCAGAWLLSAGYITLYRRHIAITVITDMAPPPLRRRLGLVATTVGFFAIYVLLEAALEPMLKAVDLVQRTGSGFNSPMPMLLKIGLVVGALLYTIQNAANLLEDVAGRLARTLVVLVAGLMALRLGALVIEHYAGANGVTELVWGLFSPLDALGQLGREIGVRDIDIGWVTLAIVLVLLALMLTGMPLGVVTLTVSILCAVLFFGPRGLFLVSSNVLGLLEHYTLVAVPLFVLMSCILERSGVAQDLFDAMSVFAGNLRGGVAVQTTLVAVVLAAMTGIMGGEIVMLGLVALPQMIRLGYDRKLAMGTICAAGSLATLIPPSIIMIVYALAAQVAIGDLFLAGVVPGAIFAALYITYILIICRLKPELAPTAAERSAAGQAVEVSRHRLVAVFMAISVIAMVMGSIYAGIASVTEAAGVGVVGAMLVALVRGRLTLNMLMESLQRTMATVGTIIWLVLGAVSLVGIYNVIGGGSFMRALFTGLDIHPLLVILLMMAVLVVLGTFMEWIAIVFITVPIFAPVVVQLAPALGLDPDYAAIWFGVLFVMNMQIYFLSPPFGPACFWLKSVTPRDVELQEIFRSVLPFIGLQIIGLILVMMFPELALWLPRALGG